MRPEHERREWHLDKTVSIGHIISTLIITMSVFSWALTIDKRVEQNVQSIKFLTQNQKRVESRVDSTKQEIRQDLQAINSKLDRLIERQMRNNQGK